MLSAADSGSLPQRREYLGSVLNLAHQWVGTASPLGTYVLLVSSTRAFWPQYNTDLYQLRIVYIEK